jgi:RHS repeat-associated protein
MNTCNRAKETQNVRTKLLPFGEVRRGSSFNAFNCMKAYSFNGERYGYYGYDASGERTYKYDIFSAGSWTNQTGGMDVSLQIDKMMLYPNGYLNMNQNGEYTKHYYADALRIASKIGSGFSQDLCYEANQIGNEVDPDYLDVRMNKQHDEMMEELTELINGNQITSINPIPYPEADLCNLSGSGIETALFFYHPDHLGSTGMVTNNSSNITQGMLYAPFGEIICDYNPTFHDSPMPNYAFNAKELDEENNMYYYSARYYAPPTFISRDPMFEKYPSISPYTYCMNNPVNAIDPTGENVYGLDENSGKLVIVKTTEDDFDVIQSGTFDSKGVFTANGKENSTISISKGILNNDYTESGNKNDYSQSGFTTTGGKQGEGVGLMNFISTQTGKELGAYGFRSEDGKSELQVGAWKNNTSTLANDFDFTGKGELFFDVHTHPIGKDKENLGVGRGQASTYDLQRKVIPGIGYFILSERDGLTKYYPGPGRGNKNSDCFDYTDMHPNKSIVPGSLRPFLK